MWLCQDSLIINRTYMIQSFTNLAFKTITQNFILLKQLELANAC